MGLLELFLLAVGLSMDAFAVSVCKGLSMKQMKWKYALSAGLYFGIFQPKVPSFYTKDYVGAGIPISS